MSKKNRSPWQLRKPVTETVAAPATTEPQAPSIAPDLSPISPAQLAMRGLAGASTPDSSEDFAGHARAVAGPVSAARMAANIANAQLSTGPRSAAGLEKSSKNAVKTALTGRTVLLPTDDVEEYADFIAGFERDLKPVGQVECELVQIVADCHWRLRRIQALEYALYAHGHEQFAEAFQDSPKEERYSKILLQTHLTYEKQFRNFHIQESRLDRKSSKAMTELRRLQADRTTSTSDSDLDAFADEKDLFAALDAGYVPASLAPQLRARKEADPNGFVFSNGSIASGSADPGSREKDAA